jgi:protein-S-isoprenylcysteine O-methyltransferase Ste14
MDDERDNAGVLAPPPVFFFGAILLGLVLQRVRRLGLAGPRGRVVGALGVAAGLGLGGSAFATMARAGTTPDPREPVAALVEAGPFRRTRNPIYVGFALITAGVAALADNRWILLLLAPVLAVVRRGVVDREEAYLERRFGDDYRSYRDRVRRWL